MKLMRIKKKLKTAIFFIAPIVIVTTMGWLIAHDTHYFVVDRTQVEVEFIESQASLLSHIKPALLAEIEALKGQNLWRLSLKQVRESLLRNNWIREVEIQRRFPDQLKVSFNLQDVAFLYINAKKQIRPVSLLGEVLPVLPVGLLPSAPIVRNSKIIEDQELLKKVLDLVRQVPQIGPLNLDNVASIDYQSTTGLAFELIQEETIVYFGEQDIQRKALQVLKVTDYLRSQKQKVRVIDASFSKKVLVRPRKRS